MAPRGVLGSCVRVARKDVARKNRTGCGALPALEYSKNLKIGTTCGQSVAEIRSIVGSDTLVKRFLLRSGPKGMARPPWPSAWTCQGAVLQVPLQRVVALSSAQVGSCSASGLRTASSAWAKESISRTAPCTRVQKGEVAEVGSGPTLSLEKLLALKPDLVMDFATGGSQDDYERINSLGIPLMLTSEWQEEHPLAKIEWIKLFGKLFGVEALADSIYEQSKREYLILQQRRPFGACGGVPARGVASNRYERGDSPSQKLRCFAFGSNDTPCPRVLVGMSYGGVWYAPGGNSYTAQLIQDAGGCYLWAGDTTRELSFRWKRSCLWRTVPMCG